MLPLHSVTTGPTDTYGLFRPVLAIKAPRFKSWGYVLAVFLGLQNGIPVTQPTPESTRPTPVRYGVFLKVFTHIAFMPATMLL